MNIERLHQLFDLDPESGVLRWKVRSARRVHIGDEAGCVDGNGYRRIPVDGKRMLTHRAVFAMTHGHLPAIVDHINGNRADNRPTNLRAATKAQNGFNSKLRKDNKSGVKGVRLNESAGTWAAYCWIAGRSYHIGTFADKSAAAAAVAIARDSLHGAFARHV